MLISGVLKTFSKSLRFFCSQGKIKEVQSLHGNNSKESLDAHVNYAFNLIAEKKIIDSKSIFLKAVNISKEINGINTQITSDLIKQIGKSFLELGDIENSLQFLIQAYKIDSDRLAKDDESLLDLAINIGALYMDLNQFDSAKDYFMSVLPMVEKSNSNGLKAAFFHNLGYTIKQLDDIENGLRYLILARSYKEIINPKSKSIVETHKLIGFCYWLQKQYFNAKVNYLKLLEILEAKPQEYFIEIMLAYIDLGYLTKAINKETEMHEYFEKAYQGLIDSDLENKNEIISNMLINISKEMYRTKDWKNTLIYLEKLLEFSRDRIGEESKQTADTYYKLSATHLNQMKLTDSLNLSEKALNLRKKLADNHSDLAESYIQKGAIYNALNSLDKSYEMFLHASEILKKFPNKLLQIDFDLKLSSFYYSKKNYIQAEHMTDLTMPTRGQADKKGTALANQKIDLKGWWWGKEGRWGL